MRYRIPIQEEVRVWQNIDIVIETDDDMETIYKRMKDGSFFSVYSAEESVVNDVMYETEETVDYNFEHTSIGCINEIEEEG